MNEHALAPPSYFGQDQDKPGQGSTYRQEGAQTPAPASGLVTAQPNTHAILEGRVDPSFWLGGHQSGIYKAINPKAELVIQEGENIPQKLRDLKSREQLGANDMVLVYYHEGSQKTPAPEAKSTIRLVAAPLGPLISQGMAYWIAGSSFAYRPAKLQGRPPPFIFEETIEINAAKGHRITFLALYLDPTIRGKDNAVQLMDFQQQVLEKYFSGYEIVTIAAHLFSLWKLAESYSADLYFEEGLPVSTAFAAELSFLVQLGLIDDREAGLLSEKRAKIETGVSGRVLIHEILKTKWGTLGNGNTLQGIIKRLQKVALVIGRDTVNDLLMKYSGLYTRGIVGTGKNIQEGSPMVASERSPLDFRPIHAGLLSACFVTHDMAVKNIVNPNNQRLVGLYGGAGADISNFLLSTNAPEAYFVADYQGLTAKDLAALNSNYWVTDYRGYCKQKRVHGYAGAIKLQTTMGIINALVLELMALGVDPRTLRMDSDEGFPRLTFEWQYQGAGKSQTYSTTFVTADITKPKDYPTKLRKVLNRGIDLYYQRAAYHIACSYQKKDCFLSEIKESMRDGGHFITDDYALNPSYTGHAYEEKFLDMSSAFPLPAAEIPIPNVDWAVQTIWDTLWHQTEGQMRNRYTHDKNPELNYGWRVRIRQKTGSSVARPKESELNKDISREDFLQKAC